MNVMALQSGKYNSHWLSKLDFISLVFSSGREDMVFVLILKLK